MQEKEPSLLVTVASCILMIPIFFLVLLVSWFLIVALIRVLFVGAPFALIGGVLLFIYQMRKGA